MSRQIEQRPSVGACSLAKGIESGIGEILLLKGIVLDGVVHNRADKIELAMNSKPVPACPQEQPKAFPMKKSDGSDGLHRGNASHVSRAPEQFFRIIPPDDRDGLTGMGTIDSSEQMEESMSDRIRTRRSGHRQNDSVQPKRVEF